MTAEGRQARAGFEGIFQTTSFYGFDWAKLCAAESLFGNYWFTPAEFEFITSMKRPEAYWGFWNGCYPGVVNEYTQRWCPWRCLYHGMNSVWFWVPYWGGAYSAPFGIYQPDYRENPVHTPFLEGLREIQSGIGKLLLNARRTPAPVALHYSQASVHACTLDDGGFQAVGAGAPTRMHGAWLTAAWSLKEAGLQPQVVPYNAIEKGALSDYRVLILPFSQALSLEEGRRIRAFVEAGGVVVADVRPGLRDGHGKLQPAGLLDDLFGIERIGSARPAAPADLPLDLALAEHRLRGVLPLAQPDPAVRVTTGTALAHAGEIPLFIERTVGKGRTLLLNFAGNYAPGTYGDVKAPEIHNTPAGDLYREIALACAALGGVQPELTATEGGQPLRGIDMVTWKDGGSTYYGFTPNDFCDFAWVMTVPDLQVNGRTTEPGCFYDVRVGRFLGEGTTFTATLKASSALLVARLPYRVRAVTVVGPASAARGATVSFPVEVVPEKGNAGNHVVRIEVTANGRPLPYHSANLKAPNGRVTFTWPLALNAPPGEWVVTARDVATGVTGRRTVRVR